MSGGDPAELLARGLADRLRGLLRALDRQDRLETATAFVGWLAGERRRGGLGEHARALLLRALATAADPVNHDLLHRLDPVAARPLAELMEATGLGRVDLSERLHDLAQAGLVSRELIGDEIRATPLAEGMVALVARVADEAARALDRELAARDATPARGGEPAELVGGPPGTRSDEDA